MRTDFNYATLFEKRELKLLFYISRIVFPNQPVYLYPFYMFYHFCKIHDQKKKYQIQKISNAFMKQLSDEMVQFQIDDNYTVVTKNKFLKSNSTAILRIEHESGNIHVNVKTIYNRNVDENTILVTTNLLFNIKNKMNKCVYEGDSLTATIIGLSSGAIGFAEEIHFAFVNSPVDSDNIVLDSVVKNYFEKPKLVCENDVIGINIKKYLLDVPHNITKMVNFKDNIYFKCTKILPSSAYGKYAVLGETTVKQIANTQSFIPQCVGINTLFPVEHRYGKIENESCPDGLKVYSAEIEAAMKPFLSKKLAMKPAFLITGKRGSGKEIIISSIASKYGMHFYKVTNFEISAHVYAQNETKLKNVFFNAKLYAPCILYMNNFENFEKNNEGQTDERIISHFTSGLKNLFENNNFPVILFCSSNEEKIAARLKREFLEVFKINAPTKEERIQMLEWLFQTNNIKYVGDLEEISQKTNTFLFEDFKVLIRLAKMYQTCDENSAFTKENLIQAIDYMQLHYNRNIGTPKVPKVLWDDIGGLNEVKEEIIKTINFPLRHPEFLKTTGLRRLGILLFGPPGTGKTLLAKAVATECNLTFLSVKGPELLNMYIGQSEENIREVFERARAASPCIIFFDELDSLAPNRGVSGDSGGVMDRVVSQLLAEMDGLNEKATVFIIGATNRPDLIDPALLRPGRFDKLLYVGPAMDFTSRLSVLKALTRKFNLSEGVSLADIVNLCPSNISGADFYGICSDSWLRAVRRTIHEGENGSADIKNLTEKNVVVNTDDFKQAINSVKPSVTEEDLIYFEKLKKEISSNR